MQNLNNIKGEIQRFEMKVKAIETKRGNLKTLLESKNVEKFKKIPFEQRIDTAINMKTLEQIGKNINKLTKTKPKVDSGRIKKSEAGGHTAGKLYKNEKEATKSVR